MNSDFLAVRKYVPRLLHLTSYISTRPAIAIVSTTAFQ